MVNPTPTVALDGALLNCLTDVDPTGATVFPDYRSTLVGDLSIQWGRDNQWDQPDPAVLTFSLWEPASLTSTWLQKVVQKRAMRRPVAVIYNRPGGQYPGDRYIFQGFTTNVDVTASRQRTRAGMTDGWLVQIQATARPGFLGNVGWYAGELPAETMQARAVRINNQAAPIGIRQMYFEDRFRNGMVRATEVTDKSVLDTLNDMYKSFADQWTYNPHRNVVIRIPTGSNWGAYALRLGVSRNVGSNTVRLYPPNWVDPTGQESPIDRQAYPAAYIGACQVSGQIALSADTITDITAIACNWFDAVNNVDHTTVIDISTAPPPTRLEFDSWYTDGLFIDPMLDDVKRVVSGDAAKPMHPQIHWDTSKTGDIPDWQTFEVLTLPAQTIQMLVLAGSPFSGATGYPPVWHPCGGVIRYADGKWDITTNLAPTNMPLPANHKPVTCAGINQYLTIGDPDQWNLDPSISCFDLYYVNNEDLIYYYD